MKAGNRLYRVREFERAIEEYKAGAIKEDAEVFSYNLAQCYRQLGKYEEAIWYYERFMFRSKPAGEMKDAIEGFLKQMKDELSKKAMTQPPTEPQPAEPAPKAATAMTAAAATAEPKIAPPVDRDEAWYQDSLGWGAVGVGAAGVGVSLGLLVTANGIDDDAGAAMEQDERTALYGRAHDRRVVATIVGVAGGVVLAAGVVKLVLHPKSRDRGTQAVQVGITGRGIALMGSF